MEWLCIVKTAVAWLLLMVIGANLIGFVVRGFFHAPPAIEAPSERVEALFAQMNRANIAMTLLGIALSAGYLFALFHYWNALLALAGGMLMASRIPDLLWEIKHGKPVGPKSTPKGPLYVAATLVMWGAIPLV